MLKRSTFLAVLLVLGLPSAGLAVSADVVDISTNYFEVVHGVLNAATSSIHMAMYDVRVYEKTTNSPPYRLVQSLIDAHRRGIDVVLYLDCSRRYTGTEGVTATHTENATAQALLERAGIKVRSCYPTRLHAKLIVIDGEVVVDGSTNWSFWGLTRNVESGTLIRSREVAEQKLLLFERLAEKSAGKKRKQADMESVSVPRSLLLDKRLGPHMVRHHSERAFDLYLLLTRNVGGVSTSAIQELSLDYEQAARALGIQEMERSAYRRQISKTLRKLAKKYGLLDVEFVRRGPARVRLLRGREDAGASLALPRGYWDYGWSRKLNMSAKFMYMVCLYKQSGEGAHRRWSCSQQRIAEDFGISKDSVGDGLRELAENDLLDIRLKTAPQSGKGSAFSKRVPSDYALRPLRSEADIARGWQAIAEKYGDDVLMQARSLGALLNVENRQGEVGKLAAAIKKYTYEVVAAQCRDTATRRRDNPRRTVDYMLGILARIVHGEERD